MAQVKDLIVSSDAKILGDLYANSFTGADGTNPGKPGLVPAPSASNNNLFLKGDGTWATPPGTTYSAGTGIAISGTNAISVSYGTTATTACVGNDSRLSNSRTPTSHASTATTYGIGTTTNYGHCMTINNLTTSSHADGKALSAYQGYVLNQKIKYGTSDYTAGTTALATGTIYCYYT